MRKENSLILVGRIGHTYGLQGWVKIRSSTTPEDAILNYRHWFILSANQKISLLNCQMKGSFIIGQIQNCTTPEAAKKFANSEIFIPREELPSLHQNEFYWTDLIGLQVYNLENIHLGQIESLFETGANDVIIVNDPITNKKILIPYVIDNVIKKVDLDANKMVVEWQKEWF